MQLRCGQCLTEVHDELGYRSPTDEVLCGPCYFALWGPQGRYRISPEIEIRRPTSRRPKRGRPIWIPGPTGELDPEEPARRRRAR